MVQEIAYSKNDVLHLEEDHPNVSVILPFEPKMSVHRELELRLQRVLNQVEKGLIKTYSPEKVKPVADKLKALIRKIDFTSFKQSVAIFVSPAIEKIYYLDIPVEETVAIDESFDIRDLVYSKKDVHKYLILLLSEERSQVFLGNDAEFFCIVSNLAGPHG